MHRITATATALRTAIIIAEIHQFLHVALLCKYTACTACINVVETGSDGHRLIGLIHKSCAKVSSSHSVAKLSGIAIGADVADDEGIEQASTIFGGSNLDGTTIAANVKCATCSHGEVAAGTVKA